MIAKNCSAREIEWMSPRGDDFIERTNNGNHLEDFEVYVPLN